MAGFCDIRETILEKAPLAAAAVDCEEEGVEWTTFGGNEGPIEGEDRPLLGGESETTWGVGWTYLSMKNFSLER